MGDASHHPLRLDPGAPATAAGPASDSAREPEHPVPPPSADAHSLALMLAPVLNNECRGHLSTIQWFHARWQNGGAETGSATWTFPDGSTIPCIVKLPVGPAELAWTTRLGGPGVLETGTLPEPSLCPTPRVLAASATLNGYDLGWIVVEQLPGEPMSALLTPRAIEDLVHAAADFHERAERIRPVEGKPKPVDFESAIARARAVVKESGMPEAHRWNDALKHVKKSLPVLLAKWESRPLNCWCHGDLHPGNAMYREDPKAAAGPVARPHCVLIDLALVHPGHWIEDAVYLERQYWGRPDLLHGVKPVSLLAKIRRERGLTIEGDYGHLAAVRRVLMASLQPLFLDREGYAKHLHASLEAIEHALPMVGH